MALFAGISDSELRQVCCAGLLLVLGSLLATGLLITWMVGRRRENRR